MKFSRHDEVARNYRNMRAVGATLARCQYHVPGLLNFILEEFNSSTSGRSSSDLKRYRGIVRRSNRNMLWRGKMCGKLNDAYARMQDDRR